MESRSRRKSHAITYDTSYSNGARRIFEYDAANRLHREYLYSDATTLLRDFEYGYDSNNNRTDETETRYNPDATYHTQHACDELDRVETINDGYGGSTTYHYDAVGGIESVTDPSGFSMAITPRTATTPETITHTDANSNMLATTINHYDTADRLDGWTTTDPVNNLTLTTEMPFNSNGYVDQANVSHQGSISLSLTSSLQYKPNNLLETISQQYWNDDHFLYDDAGRLTCSEYNGATWTYLTYDESGRRTKRYWNTGYNCATIEPWAQTNQSFGAIREINTYDGWKLRSSTIGNCATDNCVTSGQSLLWTRTFTYDLESNLHIYTHDDNTSSQHGLYVLTYNWEPGTHLLKSFTRAQNGATLYSVTFEYDHLNRIRKYCPGDCQVFSYVGDSDWISTIQDQYGTLRQRYLYANGRPLRVDIPFNGTPGSWYLRYNARGDAASYIQGNGDGVLGWRQFGAWGDGTYEVDQRGYYYWNAAWGYMRFPGMNINLHDVLDVGLYYAHGRWYNGDTGLWLSPNEKGEYLNGLGNDPLNKMRRVLAGFSDATSSAEPHYINTDKYL